MYYHWKQKKNEIILPAPNTWRSPNETIKWASVNRQPRGIFHTHAHKMTLDLRPFGFLLSFLFLLQYHSLCLCALCAPMCLPLVCLLCAYTTGVVAGKRSRDRLYATNEHIYLFGILLCAGILDCRARSNTLSVDTSKCMHFPYRIGMGDSELW